jgi:hypothetical protein
VERGFLRSRPRARFSGERERDIHVRRALVSAARERQSTGRRRAPGVFDAAVHQRPLLPGAP